VVELEVWVAAAPASWWLCVAAPVVELEVWVAAAPASWWLCVAAPVVELEVWVAVAPVRVTDASAAVVNPGPCAGPTVVTPSSHTTHRS